MSPSCIRLLDSTGRNAQCLFVKRLAFQARAAVGVCSARRQIGVAGLIRVLITLLAICFHVVNLAFLTTYSISGSQKSKWFLGLTFWEGQAGNQTQQKEKNEVNGGPHICGAKMSNQDLPDRFNV